jgi:hypothetical protein
MLAQWIVANLFTDSAFGSGCGHLAAIASTLQLDGSIVQLRCHGELKWCSNPWARRGPVGAVDVGRGCTQ